MRRFEKFRKKGSHAAIAPSDVAVPNFEVGQVCLLVRQKDIVWGGICWKI